MLNKQETRWKLWANVFISIYYLRKCDRRDFSHGYVAEVDSLLCFFSQMSSIWDDLQEGSVKSNVKEDRVSSTRGQNDEVCETRPFLTLPLFYSFIAFRGDSAPGSLEGPCFNSFTGYCRPKDIYIFSADLLYIIGWHATRTKFQVSQ